jgi:hypothetical protein
MKLSVDMKVGLVSLFSCLVLLLGLLSLISMLSVQTTSPLQTIQISAAAPADGGVKDKQGVGHDEPACPATLQGGNCLPDLSNPSVGSQKTSP